ncbi:hypothetical protein C5167_047701 [Papaver somniferum]|uniref:Gnk2-homologous domain-containing protein n=1 Tax=Papaver somniferum TaxID=3469 RepID=A0A4Y7LLG4_PAPSO|nr:cysteine-rich repeat secretory protein 11-like [Papaver somniferum]RZC84915.1 hypothetical protein C5167_047701 [Papaver somniferum]
MGVFTSLTLILVIISTTFVSSSKSAPDYSTVVYKGCANQTFADSTGGGVYSQALSGLFTSLISQSSKTKFFKASAGGNGGGSVSFTGIFQCRGDLSNGDCYSCVSKLPKIIDNMCGKTIAGRVQLTGCYVSYAVSNFPVISGVQMLYKTCGRSQASGVGFEERRDTAFASVADGIVNQNNGFYTSQYQSVYVLAQCEGDLSTNDCGECVKTVVQKSQVECGSSISGQIYLNKCYMTYTYYPNGISKKDSPGDGAGGGGGGGGGAAQNTGKTIAIVVGGAAGVGFLVICLMFTRSLLKKHDDDDY